MKRPNLLFLMTDEQRYDAIGAVNAEVITPHLNALAAESIVFSNAYTSNPSCIPARAAIYTGRYPSQCGAPTFITYLPETEKTFMSILRENGYYTAVIGKQHFAASAAEHGYDYEDIIDDHGPRFSGRKKDSSYIKFLRESGFSEPAQLTEPDDRYTWRWKEKPDFYVDEFVGDQACRWFDEQAPKLDRPWFAAVSFPGPHQPFDGIGLPEESLYDEDALSLPHTGQADLAQKPAYYMDQLETGHGNPGRLPVKDMTPAEARHVKKSYYAKISLIDKKIGQLLAVLKKHGMYDNTLILFTSDHGDFMGEFGMLGKGQYLSEALVRIPMLLKPPVSGYAGRTESSCVSSVDAAATFLTAAGIPLPDNISSDSLTRYYQTETPEKNGTVYLEAGNIRGIVHNGWKLIYYRGRSYGELYHLEQDPYEKNNLWDRPEYREIRSECISLLCDAMITLGARSHVPWNVNAPEF